MKAQGLPINMIVITALALLVLVVVGAFFISGFGSAGASVITALALLVLVVVGAFFISGFGSAGASVQIVNATQAECQSVCQGLATAAFNYDTCTELEDNPQAQNYINNPPDGMGCASQYGACTVTIRGGVKCTCDTGGCS